MNYNSAYLWEKGCECEMSPISLVLQQAVVRRHEVVLACICEGKSDEETGMTESGYFTEGLTEWFHRELLQLCERKGYEDIGRSLKRVLERMHKEIVHYVQKKERKSDLHCVGMVCVGDAFWLFQQGDCACYLLNKRYNRKHIKRIGVDRESKEAYFQGKLQKKVGLLFCTSGYGNCLKPEELAEVLVTEGSCSEERMQKRLQELWLENARRGEKHAVGAIWLKV